MSFLDRAREATTRLLPAIVSARSRTYIAPSSEQLEQNVIITCYTFGGNSPPGAGIAYPKSMYPTLHEMAGGTGTYADPFTCASDTSFLAIGQVIYVPRVRKYFVMEDDIGLQPGDDPRHIDLWQGADDAQKPGACFNCGSLITGTGQASYDVIVNPDANHPVAPGTLNDVDAAGNCVTPVY